MRRIFPWAALALAAIGCGSVEVAPPGTTTTQPTPTCEAPLADCDHDGTCETTLGTTDDCGACGDVCAPIHAAASCAAGACKLTCDAGFTDCNGLASDGCEAQLGIDPHNCGACGNDCGAWGDCLQGTCVKILASAPAFAVGADALLIEGQDLYWSAGGLDAEGMIGRVPLAGGASKTLAAEQIYADDLRSNGSMLAWNDWGALGIYAVPLAGGTVETLWLPPGSERPLVVEMDASRVYFSTGPDLRSVPLAGGADTIVAQGFTDIAAGLIHDGWIYLADHGPVIEQTFQGSTIDGHPEGEIVRVSLTTGEVQHLVQHRDTPSALAIAGGTLYWVESGSMATFDVEGGATNLGTLGSVMRASLDGTSPEVIADQLVQPVDLAADDTHLYWGCAGTPGGTDPADIVYHSDGALMRAPLAGGPAETVMPAIDAERVVVSGDTVFFASWVYGVILAKAKP